MDEIYPTHQGEKKEKPKCGLYLHCWYIYRSDMAFFLWLLSIIT